jgi:murein L,D-transpeptidase YafK
MPARTSILFFIITIFVILSFNQSNDFKAQQLKNERVKQAYSEKYDTLSHQLKKAGIDINSLELFLHVFKYDEIIEVWVKNKTDQQFKFFKTYNFCAFSGYVGPKRKQGDWQIPEGFYYISIFNPWSNFYLSLGINYPNTSDKILGDKKNPGGSICIHCNCVTIGCIPITDDKIKELYLLTVESKNNGQAKIPVYIFPAKMTADNYKLLQKEYSGNVDNLNLWSDLKTAYDYFDKNHVLPKISFLTNGRHKIE